MFPRGFLFSSWPAGGMFGVPPVGGRHIFGHVLMLEDGETVGEKRRNRRKRKPWSKRSPEAQRAREQRRVLKRLPRTLSLHPSWHGRSVIGLEAEAKTYRKLLVAKELWEMLAQEAGGPRSPEVESELLALARRLGLPGVPSRQKMESILRDLLPNSSSP